VKHVGYTSRPNTIPVVVGGGILRWDERAELGISRDRTYWSVSKVAGSARFGVHNNNATNLRRGLVERVLYRVGEQGHHEPIRPMDGVFEEDLSAFRQEVARVVPHDRPITRQQFVECYEGRKKHIYQAAADSLAARPLVERDSYLSTFVKCEKLPYHKLHTSAPRVIQPRGPRYNVELGRYLKKMEHHIVRGMAEVFGAPTIFKGLNAREAAQALRQKWDKFTDPVAIGMDATRFDQHVSRAALEFEHSVYLACVPRGKRRRLQALLRMQLVNRGFARTPDGTIKYAVEGRRMSGDMNTGMGNCLLMCAMVWRLRHVLGLPLELVNNGDDCVIITERRYSTALCRAIPRHFMRYGFVMEVEKPVDVFEHIEFCQTHPVLGPDGWVMCRDPRVCVSKDLTTSLDLATGFASWAHHIGSGGLALASGLPVLQELYSLLLRHGRAGKVHDHPWMDNGFSRLARGMDAKRAIVTDDSRVSFWRAFGILPDMQVELEAHWAEMTLEPFAGVTIGPVASFFDNLT